MRGADNIESCVEELSQSIQFDIYVSLEFRNAQSFAAASYESLGAAL
jgi:hypothetical protein